MLLRPPLRPLLRPVLRSPLERGGGLGARNLLSKSNRAPTVNSVSTPAPFYESEADPAGNQTAWKFLAGTTGVCQSNVSIAADYRPYLYTMRVKALSSGARVYMPTMGISGGQSNGASNAYYDFDTDTFGSGATNWYSEADSNGFIKLRRIFINSGKTTFVHRIDPNETYTNGKVALAWHQLEVRNTQTPYEQRPTAGATLADGDLPMPRAHVGWGDSLTAGDGDDGAPNGYTKRLNTIRRFNYLNKGVGGETSTQIKTRVLADLDGLNYWLNIFWVGNNNSNDPTTVKADIAACVANLPAVNDRYLVIGITAASTSTPEVVAAIGVLNDDLQTLYGSRYLDVVAYLQTKGDGSANDNADIAAGFVPRSLRVDTIHLNAAGYQHVADCVAAKLSLLGW